MHPIREQYYEQMKELSMACNRVAELGYVTSHGGNLSKFRLRKGKKPC